MYHLEELEGVDPLVLGGDDQHVILLPAYVGRSESQEV